jgi:hypothetical protein
MQNEISFEAAKELTRKVFEISAPPVSMVKLPIDNIVFGQLGEIPLLEMLLNLNVVTKEHIQGTVYDKKAFHMVMRIINGKLLMKGPDQVERPDAYAWHVSKVLKEKNKKHIGFQSVEGAYTYADVLATIPDPHHKELFTNMLVELKHDLLLIHTAAEDREVIVVTEEMITKHGITHVPNSYDIEWPSKNATGVKLTPVKVGDALVVEHMSFGPAVYVVQADEFRLTYAPRS